MEICLRCHTQPSKSSYLEGNFEHDMKMVLSRLEIMENLISKFTHIFSQITVLTPQQLEVKPEIIVPSSNNCMTEIEVAEEYVAQELAKEESQHSEMLDYEYLAETSQEETENEQQKLQTINASGTTSDITQLDQIFPLKTFESLESVEKTIKSNPIYKAKLKIDLKQLKEVMGTESNFANVVERIIDRQLLHDFNWYGFKGKKGLQKYSLFSELLLEIHEKMYNGQKNFVKDMNLAISTSHRRKNNQMYRKRRR